MFVDVGGPSHAQFDDVTSQFGIDDPAQDPQHVVGGRGRRPQGSLVSQPQFSRSGPCNLGLCGRTAGRLDVLKASGDNTRYAIYLSWRVPPSRSTAEVAASLGLHVDTVRPHLERMREVGLLEVHVDARGGVGRPQHRYALAPEAPSLGFEPPLFPLATRLMLRLAADAGATAEEAVEIGRDQGRSDGRRARPPCLEAVVERLATLGFDPAVVETELARRSRSPTAPSVTWPRSTPSWSAASTGDWSRGSWRRSRAAASRRSARSSTVIPARSTWPPLTGRRRIQNRRRRPRHARRLSPVPRKRVRARTASPGMPSPPPVVGKSGRHASVAGERPARTSGRTDSGGAVPAHHPRRHPRDHPHRQGLGQGEGTHRRRRRRRPGAAGRGPPGRLLGFQLRDVFDSEIAEDDEASVFGTVKVVVDPMSAQLLTGATLDYKDGLQSSGSRSTTQRERTCGCGQSFS